MKAVKNATLLEYEKSIQEETGECKSGMTTKSTQNWK